MGKWEDRNESRAASEQDNLEFLASGIAYYGMDGKDREMWTTWKVNGNTLQLGDPTDAPQLETKLVAASWLNETFGWTWSPWGETFIIESIDSNVLRMRIGEGPHAERFVMRRLK